MKVSVTISKGEKNSTEDLVLKDPCTHIDCGNIDCDVCPLHEVVVELRKAQEKFSKILQSIDEE